VFIVVHQFAVCISCERSLRLKAKRVNPFP
jgi:hypothetical protein